MILNDNDTTVAVVDLDIIAQNIKDIKKYYPAQHFLLPVKANAYGHGAYEVSLIAQECGVDCLGVANIMEADYLRKSGIKMKIMILGLSPYKHIPEITRNDVAVTVADTFFLKLLSAAAEKANKKIEVHLKIDTGMGRAGITPDDAAAFIRYAKTLPGIELNGIFTHLSSADMIDEDSREFTLMQFNMFSSLLKKLDTMHILPPLRHISNSAGIVNFFNQTQDGYFNMIRPGIMVYGYPCKAYFKSNIGTTIADKMKISLQLFTHITGIQMMRKGDYISYGRTYRIKSPAKIAILSMGYADGFSRRLSNIGEVIVNKKRCKVAGRVCMDQTMINVDNISNLNIGQRVIVIGNEGKEEVTAQDIADTIGTISYEVLTMLSKRVRRIYKRGDEIMNFDINTRKQIAVELLDEDEFFADSLLAAGESRAEILLRKAEAEAIGIAEETKDMDDEKANEYVGSKIFELKKKYRQLAQKNENT